MSEPKIVEETWVNVTEAAEITGYNRGHILRLARTMWHQSEADRPVKLRKRTSGYDLWLPDLMTYIQREARGPYTKRPENR